MKRTRPALQRLLRGLAAAALALAGAVVPSAAATAAPAGVSVLGGVDDFTFDSFDAQYTLGIDDEKRSTLTTTETLVAVFPDFDQNRGIRRYIPTTYQGHPLQNRLVSVTDENGTPRDYETSFESDDSGSYQVLTIAVPEGQYVHGAQTYVITYTQRDVTAYFEDTDDDEFYWDVNGTGWAQPFGTVSATLTLADGLAERLVSTSCYYGYDGSNDQCEATTAGDTVTASVDGLLGYQNMTVVAAFPAGTFAPAPFDLFAWIPPAVFVGLGTMLAGVVAGLVMRFTVLRGAKGTGIVIAQYEPAEDISPFMAANLLGATKRGMAAAIVDLAVRRKIRIIEKPDEGIFASGTTFGVQRVGDDSGLDADDARVLSALFATSGLGMLRRLMSGANPPGLITLGTPVAEPAPADASGGPVRWLTKKDQILGQQVVAITKATAAEALRRKLRRRPPVLPIVIIALVLIAGFLIQLFGGFGATTDLGIFIGVLGTILTSWLAVGTLVMLGGRRPLTKEGALAVEHLRGLREYIRLAEADRLQMLQSVTGAERVGTDAGSVVKIYEKLLPYAVLFGLEKEWAGELAKYYDETPPDWYGGSNISAFNVGAFAAGIGSLSSSVSSSFSGSASSSSSGGSGGGGSSGGGGGGGGGGGV
ncbi:MAG TPA: DUF2207 domain-containing protein [Pseudolysinimonas sp.]|nr:DUF2207 domain-containing protein [Pseudolysinimonas sp.]